MPLKWLNNQIGTSNLLDSSDLKPGTYHLQIQFPGNNYIKQIAEGKSFTVYSKEQLIIS